MHYNNLLLVPANFHLANIDDLANMNNLAANKVEKNFPVTRLDSNIDLFALQYIVYANSSLNKANQETDLIIQISDLGSGKLFARLSIMDKIIIIIA